MKRNSKLFILLLLIAIFTTGISYAYFMIGIGVQGSGEQNTSKAPEELLKVEYAAGNSALNADGIYPGESVNKDFSITVTPSKPGRVKTVTYSIIIDIDKNGFKKCDNSTYEDFVNECLKGANELVYTIKDNNNNILSTGYLEGKTGKQEILTETKIIDNNTTFDYHFTLELKDTGAEQNHNTGKEFIGNIKVEFTESFTDKILANMNEIRTETNFNNIATSSTTGVIYKQNIAVDNVTYYFRGAPNDNYVEFAGFYWRIIRINENGSIRMIYSGKVSEVDAAGKTKILANGYVDTSNGYLKIAASEFNPSNAYNEYVGFTYKIGTLRGTSDKSTALKLLENWYRKNLTNIKTNDDGNMVDENGSVTTSPIIDNAKTNYDKYLDKESGFCGDRTLKQGTGIGSNTETYFKAYERLKDNKKPIFSCPNESDLYTVSSSTIGNKVLTYPIGLITGDEIVYAGGLWYNSNTKYYLYTGYSHRSMTPSGRHKNNNSDLAVYNLGVSSGGSLYEGNVTGISVGIRPVINISGDVGVTGNGTITSPYKVA